MVAYRYTGEVLHPYSAGLYDDEFVRTDEGWRISRREMVLTPVIPVAGS